MNEERKEADLNVSVCVISKLSLKVVSVRPQTNYMRYNRQLYEKG